jgi:hypothetical protein
MAGIEPPDEGRIAKAGSVNIGILSAAELKTFIDDARNKLCTLRSCSSEPILFRVEQGVPLKNRGTMEQVV